MGSTHCRKAATCFASTVLLWNTRPARPPAHACIDGSIRHAAAGTDLVTSDLMPFAGSRSIQVIDDDSTIRSAFRRPIGAAAIDGHPEAVVVDVRMPLEDILAFVRQLRAHPSHTETPVTIITDEYVADNSVRVEIARLHVPLCLKPPGPEHVPQFAAALLMLNDEF